MVRLFQVELEHYEKIEGTTLSLDGKANRLATMIRGNLGLAMQGLAVVPLFAGYDLETAEGRIFSYDVTGGRYEEHGFHTVGSGSVFARGALKKLYRADFDVTSAVTAAIQALYDAADDDSATGGPDLTRRDLPGRRRGHRGRLPPAARHRGRRAGRRQSWSRHRMPPRRPQRPAALAEPRSTLPQPD